MHARGAELTEARAALIAYLATLLAIVVMTLAAALIVILADLGDQQALAQVIAALAFISASVTGLIGVIGAVRPRAQAGPGQ